MEAVIHLDTHVLIWLYIGEAKRLHPVEKILDSHQLVISPMVILELEFLKGIGKLQLSADKIIGDLVEQFGVVVSTTPFSRIIRNATQLNWTQDPFDRIIVANALAEDADLLTCDRNIRKHCHRAIWNKSQTCD